MPLKSPITGCLPCVVCGNSNVRRKIISDSSFSKAVIAPTITLSGGISFSAGVLYFVFPCRTGNFLGNICATDSEYNSTGTIISDRTGNFLVTFRVRGVIETTPPDAWENQGTTISPYVQKNPSGYSSENNVYSFILGDDTYVLNWHTWDGSLTVLDYTFQIEIASGESYTLNAKSEDAFQTSNFQNLSAVNNDRNNPIVVLQPYNGQFIQMDVQSWVYLG
jgi:hypothetical protein